MRRSPVLPAAFLPAWSFYRPHRIRILTSIKQITFIVVGGLGSITGSILGAVVLTALPELLRGVQEYAEVVYGLILLGTLLFCRRGSLV